MIRVITFLLLILCVHGTCNCTCDYEAVGRGTWTLLHEIVKRPPNERVQAAFNSFMWSLAELYPCETCRYHLSEYLYNHPPTFDPIYLCQLHNNVNKRLGKPQQPCWDI